MAAVVSVATFEKTFMRKGVSIATLKRTIKNSKIRLNASLSVAAKQTELNRIQGAANAIEKRGTFSQKVAVRVEKKLVHREVESRASLRPFIRKHKTALAVGGVALLLVGALVVRS